VWAAVYTCRGRKLATATRLQENLGSKQKCDSGQAASATCDAVLDLRSYSENVDAVLLAAAGPGGCPTSGARIKHLHACMQHGVTPDIPDVPAAGPSSLALPAPPYWTRVPSSSFERNGHRQWVCNSCRANNDRRERGGGQRRDQHPILIRFPPTFQPWSSLIS